MTPPRNRGTGDLTNTRVSKPETGRALAAEDHATIAQAQQAGQEGMQAGAEGQGPNPATQPGSNGALPADFRALIPGPEVNVP